MLCGLTLACDNPAGWIGHTGMWQLPRYTLRPCTSDRDCPYNFTCFERDNACFPRADSEFGCPSSHYLIYPETCLPLTLRTGQGKGCQVSEGCRPPTEQLQCDGSESFCPDGYWCDGHTSRCMSPRRCSPGAPCPEGFGCSREHQRCYRSCPKFAAQIRAGSCTEGFHCVEGLGLCYPDTIPCRDDASCPASDRCYKAIGRCMLACSRASQCPPSLRCELDLGHCLPMKRTCTSRDQCPPGGVCRQGQCHLACQEDRGCPPRERCDAKEHVCVPAPPQEARTAGPG